MQGNQLLVGAFQEDSERAADSGAAYLFEISEDGKPTLIERFTPHRQKQKTDLELRWECQETGHQGK